MKIRVMLPAHLRVLARTDGEIVVEVPGEVTLASVISAVETAHPTLGGTIRDHATRKRRPFVRFFACGEDWSHHDENAPLPEPIRTGAEPFIILGAIAGG